MTRISKDTPPRKRKPRKSRAKLGANRGRRGRSWGRETIKLAAALWHVLRELVVHASDKELARIVASVAFGGEVRSRNGLLEFHAPLISDPDLHDLRLLQTETLVRRLMNAREVRAYVTPDLGGGGRPKGEPVWPSFGLAFVRSGKQAREFPIAASFEFVALLGAIRAFLFMPATSTNEWRAAAAHPLMEPAFAVLDANDKAANTTERFRALGAAIWREV